MKDRIWTRGDLLAGLFTGLVAFALYAWTAAPNVTLLDSGEFITAAEHFGVPHPTGYPLWTLSSWLFLLLPLGNAAWEIAIFSGFCAAWAVGLTTALARSSLRWLMAEVLEPWRGLGTIVPVTCGLLFAFSFSMWSQATIAEVYALHALMIGLYVSALYTWLRRPDRLELLFLAFFLLTLSFSNHHLTLAMAPLPFIVVLLVRRDMFLDLVVAACLTALLAYLGFAILSAEPLVLKTAIRFFYCVMLGLVVLVGENYYGLRGEDQLVFLTAFLGGILLLPVDFLALGWLGMWLGLVQARLGRAIFQTVACVSFSVWGGTFLAGYLQGGNVAANRIIYWVSAWFAAGGGISLVLAWWARRRLLRDFRKLALESSVARP